MVSLNWVTQWLFGGAAAEESTAEQASAQATPSIALESRGSDESLDQALKARRGAGPLVAGSIQILSLSAHQHEFAESWELLADRGKTIALKEITATLHPDDSFTVGADGQFLICFAHLSAAEAKHSADVISSRIRARLLEELPRASGRFAVDRFVGEVSPSALSEGSEGLAGALLEQLEQVRREAEAAARSKEAALLRGARVVYQPVWDVSRRRTTVNRCLLDPLSGASVFKGLEQIDTPEALHSAVSSLDSAVLTSAIKALHQVRTYPRPDLIIPVFFSTIQTDCGGYSELLNAIPQRYRKHVLLELIAIPAAADVLDLLDAIDRVTGVAGRIILQMSPFDSRLGGDMSSAVWGLALDLKRWKSNPGSASSALPRFVEATKAKGLKPVVHGANTLGDARATRDAGFELIAGTAIHLASDLPKPAAFFRASDGSGTAEAQVAGAARTGHAPHQETLPSRVVH